MKIIIQIYVCLLYVSLPLFSQTILWEKEFGTDTETMAFDLDNAEKGVIFVGRSGDSFNAFVLMSDNHGDTLWSKVYNFQNTTEAIRIVETINDGYLILSNHNYSTPSLFRIDGLGDTIWVNSYPGNPDFITKDITEFNDGYLVIGDAFTDSAVNLWVMKIDDWGNKLWEKYYSKWDRTFGKSILELEDGSYFCLGYTEVDSTNKVNLWLLKISSSGQPLSEKIYQPGSYNCFPKKIIKTTDSNYMMLASVEVNSIQQYMWLLKVNSNGDTLWSKYYPSNFRDVAISIQELSDSSFIIVGYKEKSNPVVSQNIWILKLSSAGQIIWEYIHETPTIDIGNDIVAVNDDEYIILGNRLAGRHKVILLKIRENSATVNCSENTILPFHLYNNYPNPFNSVTNIKFEIPKSGKVTVQIFNIMGQLITTIIDETLSSGSHKFKWDATNAPTGIYYCQIKFDELFKTSKKMLLIK